MEQQSNPDPSARSHDRFVGLRWKLPVVAGATAAFGVAGYLATLVVPAAYTASLDLATTDATRLEKALATTALSSGVTVSWGASDVVRVSQTSRDAANASARVDDASKRIEASFIALAPAASQAAVPSPDLDAVESNRASPEVVRAGTSASVMALEASAQRAREDAAALDAQIAALPKLEDDGDAALVTALTRQASSRAQLGSLERLRDGVANARSPDTLTAVRPAPAGWSEWIRLMEDRDRLQTQVTELSRTLLNGHPRMAMARLRLSDMDAQLQSERQTLLRALDKRLETARDRTASADAAVEAARGAEAARGEALVHRRDLERDRDIALRLADELDVSARRGQDAQVGSNAASQPVVPAKPIAKDIAPTQDIQPEPAALERTRLPLHIERVDPLPVVAASALFGFLLSASGLAFVSKRRRAKETPHDIAAVPAGEPAANGVPATAARPAFEITPIDDVIDAAIASGVTRIMLSGDEALNGARPIAVNIARRLSLRGQAVALVDLSSNQAAARTMGVGLSAPTIADLIGGDATFAAVATRDFATQAEIVPGGSAAITSPLDTPRERRNVLDFVEKSYELIIVDCTGLATEQLAALMDPDAALLVAVDASHAKRTDERIAALKQAGLDDMILVAEARTN